MEGAGYDTSLRRRAEPILREVDGDLVLYDPNTKTVETIHGGRWPQRQQSAQGSAKECHLLAGSPTSDLSEDLGEVGARRTLARLALAGNIIRELGLTAESCWHRRSARPSGSILIVTGTVLDAYRSSDPAARKRAAVQVENAVRERYGLETKKVPDDPERSQSRMAEVEDGSWLDTTPDQFPF